MDTIAIGTIATLAGLVAVTISPIIRLNTLITKLNATIEMLIRDGEKRNHRLDVHSDRLDALEHTVTEHDVKIERLGEYHRIRGERKMARGRPNSYKERIEPRKDDIIKWARAGATNKEICSALGVSYSTFCDHVSKHKDLSDSLKEARMSGVPDIKMALYKKAIGFEYEEVRTSLKKDEDGETRQHVEKIRKYSPPDTTAIQIFLRNNADDFHDRDKFTCDMKELELELKRQMMEMNNF